MKPELCLWCGKEVITGAGVAVAYTHLRRYAHDGECADFVDFLDKGRRRSRARLLRLLEHRKALALPHGTVIGYSSSRPN